MSAEWDLFDAIRLLEGGPMHQDELLDALGIDPDDDEDFLEDLSTLDEICWPSAWQIGLVRHVYGGNTFTHVVTAEEVERGVMELGVDLAVMEPIDDGPYRVPDGCVPGDLVAVRWDESDWTLERIGDADQVVGDPAVHALRDAFAEQVGSYGVMSIDSLVLAAAMSPSAPFREVRPPVSVLLADAGFEVRDRTVAPIGFDWDDLARRRRADHHRWLADHHRISVERAEQLEALTAAVWRDGDIALAAAALGDPDVVEAFVEDHLDAIALPLTAGRIGDLGRALGDTAGAEVLRARTAEQDGRCEDFAAHADRAVAIDPGLTVALRDAGYIAYVRGDARRARDLLQRGGAHQLEDERLSILRQFCEPPPGWHRNRPCPCGSGRKAKLCCIPSAAHPLEHRAHWLFDKITRFADRPPQLLVLEQLASELVGVDVSRRPDLLGLAMLQRPFWTFAAFEGGMAQAFAAREGALLPADERELLERWLPLRHRVVRLDAVDARNEAVTFTDGFTDERFVAHVRLDPACWLVGEEAVALLAPVGDRGPQLLAEPVLFHESWRDAIVEAVESLGRDPLALARTCVRWEIGASILTGEYSDDESPML